MLHSLCPLRWPSASLSFGVASQITDDMDAPIYMYYQLKNFYQNHRRYVKCLPCLPQL